MAILYGLEKRFSIQSPVLNLTRSPIRVPIVIFASTGRAAMEAVSQFANQ